MDCPKCGKVYSQKDNYCNHCGLELYKYKTIERKLIKDIKSSDIFYYYGSVFENNKITDWVKNSIVNFLKSKSEYESLYGGLTAEGELRFAIAKIGYFFKLTENLVVKGQLNYSKIKIKKLDNFKNKEDWLLYHTREMVGEKLEKDDLMRDSILDNSSLLETKVVDEAIKIIFDSLVIKQILPDFYKEELNSNIDRTMRDAEVSFYLGYWTKFFEDVYNFLIEQK
jgi:hypothetical protein